jgi:hypothetical protein
VAVRRVLLRAIEERAVEIHGILAGAGSAMTPAPCARQGT